MRASDIDRFYNTETGGRCTNAERAKIEKLREMGGMFDVIQAYYTYCEKKNMTEEWKERLRTGLVEGANLNIDEEDF
ncbi:MAG: hypothetical protein LBL42_00320 [Tannerella sp.]|jgi:hypothetical protein|nr:hypothetical protein [Tannerella sp.]